MSLPLFKNNNEKLVPCICGKEQRRMFFRTSELSPNMPNLAFGTIVVFAIYISATWILASLGAYILIPFAALLFPAVVVLLAIPRLIMRHKIICAIRWSYIAVVGVGGRLL